MRTSTLTAPAVALLVACSTPPDTASAPAASALSTSVAAPEQQQQAADDPAGTTTSTVIHGETTPPTTAGLALIVPALPVDLAIASEHGHDDHAHSNGVHDDEVSDPGDRNGDAAVAGEFAVAVYTRRFDDPAGLTRQRLTSIVAAHRLDAAAGAVPPLDADVVATWPIIDDVDAGADRWWRVEATLKATRHGQQGPTSEPLVIAVHVAGGVVDDWQLPS